MVLKNLQIKEVVGSGKKKLKKQEQQELMENFIKVSDRMERHYLY